MLSANSLRHVLVQTVLLGSLVWWVSLTHIYWLASSRTYSLHNAAHTVHGRLSMLPASGVVELDIQEHRLMPALSCRVYHLTTPNDH